MAKARILTLDETKKLKVWRKMVDKEAETLLTICNRGLVSFCKKNI